MENDDNVLGTVNDATQATVTSIHELADAMTDDTKVIGKVGVGINFGLETIEIVAAEDSENV